MQGLSRVEISLIIFSRLVAAGHCKKYLVEVADHQLGRTQGTTAAHPGEVEEMDEDESESKYLILILGKA